MQVNHNKHTVYLAAKNILQKYVHKISLGYCKKDITPLLTHWSYVFLALTQRNNLEFPFAGHTI